MESGVEGKWSLEKSEWTFGCAAGRRKWSGMRNRDRSGEWREEFGEWIVESAVARG